jgi:membrane-bound serine protease (ClpP class)
MSRFVSLVMVLGVAASLHAGEGATPGSGSGRALVLTVRLEDEAITPGVDRYLKRAIREAEDRDAECLVILLDTPGGLLQATRSIVKEILASRTCVVVYVSPPGARAASAGVFITLASHVAAMAPSTTIGAAHPVQIGGLPFEPPTKELPLPEEEDEDSEERPKEPGKETPASEDGSEKSEESKEAAKEEQGEEEEKEEKKEQSKKPAESADAVEDAAEQPEGSPDEVEDSSKDDRRRPETAMEEKIVNDTVAWIRALANLRDRNADWAARAVKESISATAEEAVQEGVVDLMAEDLDDLIEKLDGREVALPGGPRALRTAGAEIEEVPMWWGELVLALLSRPNVAFLLMIFGFYGILFELYSPGWGVAGTLGVICLLLAMFGLAVLPVNYLGLALILVALVLFVAEVFVTSFGALTLGGIVCLVLGGIMLVDSPTGFSRVSPAVVVPLAVATGLIVVFLVGGIVRAHRRRPTTGDEGLIGTAAQAKGDFARQGDRFVGTVFVHGEWWKATSDAPIASGQECEVEGRRGLTLIVRPSGKAISAER